LFDEVEKAHPDVFNLLLQVLDDGRLTDSQGRMVNFSNSLIILTSNIGSRQISEFSQKITSQELQIMVLKEVKHVFKPEFINRLDDILLFQELSRENVGDIVRLQLQHLTKTLAARGFRVVFGTALVGQISQDGFDPIYGARPLKRLIQRIIEDFLASKIIADELTNEYCWTMDLDTSGKITLVRS
jgi:ATP-dependent Clp protease ATP-binding subunit ClpB